MTSQLISSQAPTLDAEAHQTDSAARRRAYRRLAAAILGLDPASMTATLRARRSGLLPDDGLEADRGCHMRKVAS